MTVIQCWYYDVLHNDVVVVSTHNTLTDWDRLDRIVLPARITVLIDLLASETNYVAPG